MNTREKAIMIVVRTFFSNVVGNEQEVYEALVEFVNDKPNSIINDFEFAYGVIPWYKFDNEYSKTFLDDIDNLVDEIESAFN